MEVLADLAEEWELTLDNVSESSRIVYLRSVRQFTAWLAETHPDLTEPGQIQTRHVRAWLQSLADTGRSDGTRRVRLIAVRLFLAYLAGEPDTGVATNPAAGIDLPEAKLQPIPILQDEDLITLLRGMDGASFVNRRDTAIVRILLDTGCRRGELAGINVDDLDLRGQEITLRRTKGGWFRVVPIGSRTTLALRKYMRTRARHPAVDSPALFLSTRPGARSGWRITGGGVAEMLERRCRAVGLATINPHKFRHTWAHDMLAHGAGETNVERLAGWRSPLMVRRYGNSAADMRARDTAKRLRRGDRV
jgi:integrase